MHEHVGRPRETHYGALRQPVLDQSNGSFGGADAESVDGYTEKKTGVFRLAPTWTLSDGSQLAIGVSAMFGEIAGQQRYFFNGIEWVVNWHF